MSTNCLFLKDIVVIIKNYCLVISLYISYDDYFPVFQDVLSIKFNVYDVFPLLISFNNKNGYDFIEMMMDININMSLFISLNEQYDYSAHNIIIDKRQIKYDGLIEGFGDTTNNTLILASGGDNVICFYSYDADIVKYFKLLVQ